MTQKEDLVKECRRCHIVKPKTEFRNYLKKGKYICIHTYCRPCEVIKSKEYSDTHVEWRLRINKEYRHTPKGKESLKRRSKKYSDKYPERKKAMNKVGTAIRNGSLERKACEFCNKGNTDAHHHDYTKPLEVIWLCKNCHVKLHKIIIADRKRIVEPLVKYKHGKAWGNTFICEAIDQTLKLAGIEKD